MRFGNWIFLRVTDADIAEGRKAQRAMYGSGKHESVDLPTLCPIAQALKREGLGEDVRVLGDGTVLIDSQTYRASWHGRRFIETFDNQDPVKPTRIRLTEIG